MQCLDDQGLSHITMSGAGSLGLYKAVKPQRCTLFRRSLLTANLPVTLRQSRTRTQRTMKPQCTALVDNPLTAGVKSNGTGGYQHIYKELNTGDSLAKEYADDTAAALKNRRAGDAACTASVATELHLQCSRQKMVQHSLVSLLAMHTHSACWANMYTFSCMHDQQSLLHDSANA